jgi:hypothetical protein
VKRDGKGLQSDRDGERARWVDKYRISGLGLKRFAQRHGLSAGQLHYWVYGLKPATVSKSPLPVFREVRLPAATATPAPWSAEVGLPDGTTVRVVRGTDVAWTITLVEFLRRPCSSH